jgi:3-hydroxybutyrate dehydrogenase
MSQKHILITGAASGIGQGIAFFLANKGHHIIVSDMDLNNAKKTADTIIQQGGSAQAVKLNVTSSDDVSTLMASLDKPVDVLINNAGIQHVESLDTFPMDKWDFLIQVMLVGVARLTQAVLPNMKSKNFGRVINIGSLHALVASPYKSAYIAAKHGLLGFSKTVALEVAQNNITINTLCPAYVLTPLVEKQISAQAKEHGMSEEMVINDIMLKPMPKKAFIEIDELAATCEFLISEYAKNITAQAIALDGGWTAQ